jgi:hypothetical protein
MLEALTMSRPQQDLSPVTHLFTLSKVGRFVPTALNPFRVKSLISGDAPDAVVMSIIERFSRTP